MRVRRESNPLGAPGRSLRSLRERPLAAILTSPMSNPKGTVSTPGGDFEAHFRRGAVPSLLRSTAGGVNVNARGASNEATLLRFAVASRRCSPPVLLRYQTS